MRDAAFLDVSMQVLGAIPQVGPFGRSKVSPRVKALLAVGEASGSNSSRGLHGSARASPRSRRLRPMVSTAASPRPTATLKALEQYMSDVVATLPAGSLHRLHASRSVLSTLIAQLPTHGPLLSLIKQEYESILEPMTAAAAEPLHPLHPIHGLQLPAAYHEADLRHIVGRMRHVDSEVIRVARVKAHLRAGVLEVTRRCRRSRRSRFSSHSLPHGGAPRRNGIQPRVTDLTEGKRICV